LSKAGLIEKGREVSDDMATRVHLSGTHIWLKAAT
jgi:hypothetical protein